MRKTIITLILVALATITASAQKTTTVTGDKSMVFPIYATLDQEYSTIPTPTSNPETHIALKQYTHVSGDNTTIQVTLYEGNKVTYDRKFGGLHIYLKKYRHTDGTIYYSVIDNNNIRYVSFQYDPQHDAWMFITHNLNLRTIDNNNF